MQKGFKILVAAIFIVVAAFYGWGVFIKTGTQSSSYLSWLLSVAALSVSLYILLGGYHVQTELDYKFKELDAEMQQRENVVHAHQRKLDKERRDLDIRVANLNDEVLVKVERGIKAERESLYRKMDDKSNSLRIKELKFEDNVDRSKKAFQRLMDSSFKFKARTLLAGLSLKNQNTKYAQLINEVERYNKLKQSMDFLQLIDNSDWENVTAQFYEKLAVLLAAQEVKEEQAELKRQMREEKQRQDELERRQREAEEEERRLAEQQKLIEEALLAAEGQYKDELERQRLELEQQIQDVHSQYERAKSMAQLTKQGHVYVISNIGSFGENVYKVGMTRRLEPLDRVKELGDASVPFEFDVHAMISCDDAPALEKALHDELEKYRVNKVNLRKEFFNVDLGRIISSVERNHGTIEYVVNPVAYQYYKSLEFDTEAA